MEIISLLDPEKGCFFCLKNPETKLDQTKFSLCDLLSCVGLGKEEGLTGSEQTVVRVCNDCSDIVAKFKNYFRQWEEIEMKLSSCLGQIGNKLATGNDNDSVDGLEFKGGSEAKEMRERIKQKCLARAKALQPQVLLKAKPEVDSDSTQIKTESQEENPSNDHEQFILPDPDSESEMDIPLLPWLGSETEPSSTPNPLGEEGEPESGFSVAPMHYKIRKDPSNPSKPHLCELCNVSFKKLSNCQRHYRAQHLNPRPNRKPKGLAANQCKFCLEIFTSNYKLYDHINVAHKNISFPCPFCLKEFSYISQRKRHQTICPLNPEVTVVPSECSRCGQSFLGRDYLYSHELEAHPELFKFPCQLCGKRFKGTRTLKQHGRVHEKKKGVVVPPCNFCGKKFKVESLLQGHIKKFHFKDMMKMETVHGGKEPTWDCKICWKRLKTEKCLLAHQRRAHFDAKKYACETCGKRFMKPSELKGHKEWEHGRLKAAPAPAPAPDVKVERSRNTFNLENI